MPWGRYITVRDGITHAAVMRRGSVPPTLRCDYFTAYAPLRESDLDRTRGPITCLWCTTLVR